jgi:ankyrin repeat protein
MVAADAGRHDVALILLQKGAKANAKTSDGNTALHYAAAHGCVWTCQFLVPSQKL